MKRNCRFLALILAGCMCLSAGCGSVSDTGAEGTEAQKTAEASGSGEEDSDAENIGKQEESEDSDQGSEEYTAAPQLTVSQKELDKYDPDTNRWLVHTEYDTASVSGDGYETLEQSVREWSEARIAEIEALSEEYAGYAAEDTAYSAVDSESYRYSIFQSLEAARVDSRVVSIIEMSSDYTGGAHGNYGYHGYTFDAGSGQLLELADILENAGEFQENAVSYIIQSLEETNGDGLFPEYAESVRDIWTRNEGPNWYLNAAGITFIFNPYEVGPYAVGDVRVTLPYGEFASCIKDEYEGITGSGAARIPEDAEVLLGLGADEQPSRLRICQDKDENYEGPVYVELNDSAVKAGEYTYGWIEGAYVLTKEDGRTFVLLNTDEASDDFTMFLYEITDGKIRESDCVQDLSFRNGAVNTEALTLRVSLDVIGTYSAMMDYEIGEDGKLTQTEPFFRIQSSETSSGYTLTSVRELPVTVNGEEIMLPAGSRIRITATDNMGTALFSDEDTGENGEIHYTRGNSEDDSWVIYIDGTPDYECFETVPYAG